MERKELEDIMKEYGTVKSLLVKTSYPGNNEVFVCFNSEREAKMAITYRKEYQGWKPAIYRKQKRHGRSIMGSLNNLNEKKMDWNRRLYKMFKMLAKYIKYFIHWKSTEKICIIKPEKINRDSTPNTIKKAN